MAISDRHFDDSTASAPTDTEDYQRSFRRGVFNILSMAYAGLDAKSHEQSDEDTITQGLQERAQEFIESAHAPRWAYHFEVIDQRRDGSAGATGKRRPILDLLFVRTQRGRRPRFSFEAKRLYGNSGASEYIGTEGLKAYVDGTYRCDDDEAGMLGYVQSDTPENWAGKIKKTMTASPASVAVCPGHGWRRVSIARGLKHTYYSRHDRSSVGRQIAMYHTLLSFC